MAKWIIASSVLGGVVLYPEYINYVGMIEMAKWIVAGSILGGVALLAVSRRSPSGTGSPQIKTDLENASNLVSASK